MPFVSSFGPWATRILVNTNSSAPNYGTASSSAGVPLTVEYCQRDMAARPRWKSLTVKVNGGF